MTKYRPIQRCMPLVAVALLLSSSFLPWLYDPLGALSSAWQIGIDPGWPIPLLNYGLLCLICALLILLPMLPTTRRISSQLGLSAFGVTSLLCLLPLFLFIVQLLGYDFSTLNRLAQHQQQALLIQNLFFYPVADQLVPLRPFSLDITTLWGRIQLLLDQGGYGLFLPLLAFFLHLYWEFRFAQYLSVKHPYRRFFPLSLLALLSLVFLRSGLGAFCEYQARISLASGSYGQALSLLDSACLFLPELDETNFYHLERGQALYYLSPRSATQESQAYLAASYRSQQNFPAAFQQGYTLWSSAPTSPWLRAELSETLELWIASQQPLKSAPETPLDQASAVLPQLHTLEQIDASNVYAEYLDGRISYALHAYSMSQKPLALMLKQCQDPAILSSVYTYLALSEYGLGKLADGRLLLFNALSFDPNYRNNTAREALSGLH